MKEVNMCVGSQSKSVRYENSTSDEIGVKFNRNHETIIIVENSKSKAEFAFYPEDEQTLVFFENIYTNLLGFYHTFRMNFGRKTNLCESSMQFSVVNKNQDVLTIKAIKDTGIVFEIHKDEKTTKFVFSPEENTLLEMFKLELSNVIKKNVPKLPPITTNVHVSIESQHSHSRG